MEATRLRFTGAVKDRYYVRRDDCGDEYVALRGKNALGNGGLDHIYNIGPNKLGLWVTSGQINRTIPRLLGEVPGLRVEQQGEHEAVLSAPVAHLDVLCRAAEARIRPRLSAEQKLALVEAGKHSRFQKHTA